MIEFKHDFRKVFTTTVTRAVGPSTISGARGTLPQPAPTDGNAIWVATNGLTIGGGATGTSGNPVNNIGEAITLLTAGKPTIHIFRNGVVGDLEFTETSGLTLPASRNFQVEDGEIAKLTIDTFSTGLLMNANSKLNGLYIEHNAVGVVVNAANNNITISNCRIVNTNTQALNDSEAIQIELNTLLEYSILSAQHIVVNLFDTTLTPLVPGIKNNIIIAIGTDKFTDAGFQGSVGQIGINARNLTVSAIKTYTFDRNIFVNCFIAIAADVNPGQNQATPGNTFDINNCVFLNCQYGVMVRSEDNLHYETVNLDYCYLSVFGSIFKASHDDTFDTNVTLVNTNAIDLSLPVLFTDLTTGINDIDPEGFRLQHEGKTTLDGLSRYFIDSPMLGIGLSSADLNPWDESTVFTSSSYNEKTVMTFPAASYKELDNKINPASLSDANGNPHMDYDTQRRTFNLTFGANIHISKRELNQLKAMLAENGTKQFYPNGESANVFQLDTASAGLFSSIDNSVTIGGGDVRMNTNNWAGYYITISSTDYYILSNTNSKLFLSDKSGSGFPSDGPVNFIISYMLVNNDPAPFNQSQANFSEYKEGGAIRENDNRSTRYDYYIDGFVIKEAEDDEENTK